MVSEYSSVIKSNPYVVPFDLNLATQVMMYKDNQYKKNAESIQSAMEQTAALDLKEADKAKLNTKLHSTVAQLNQLSGLDLGSTNVANQLRGVVSGLYDEDLVTGLALKKNYNDLTAYYDKIMSDPKLQKLYAPQNYQADMLSAQSWLSDPNPTSAQDRGKVPNSPTPFVNIQDKLTQITKDVIKPNVIEHPTIKGWYIDKTTNEELSPEDLGNRYRGYIVNDPALMRQAQINAQYLYPNRTADDLFTSIQGNLDAGLKDIDENITKTTAEMIGLQGADLERKQKQLDVLKKNRDTYVKRKQETTKEKIEQNLDGYRTGDYIDALVQSHANLASFQKYKIETTANQALSKQAELQLSAAKEGLTIQIDPNGNPIIAVDPALQEAMKKRVSSSSSTGSISPGESAGDVFAAGSPSDNTGGVPQAAKTADEVLARTVELSQKNHAAWQQLIKNAVASDPNAKALFGSEDKASEEIVRTTLNYGYDANALDAEDIKLFSKTDKGAKMAYLTELTTAFDDLKSGKTPSRNLKESDVQALEEIHNRTIEQNMLLDMYNRSIGGSPATVLTAQERAVVADQKKNPDAYKPTRITKYDWFKANNKELNEFLNGPTSIIAKWIDKKTSRPVDPKNSLNVILSNGKYYPADGKDYTFERNVYERPYGDRFDSPNSKKLIETRKLTIPKNGIDARIVNSFVQSKPGDAVLGADESKDLLELNIITTKKQQDFIKAQEKLKNRPADPRALDFLNQTPNFKNWYYAGDAPIQKSMEFSKAKAKLMGELDRGTYPEGKYVLYKPEGEQMVKTNLVGPSKTVNELKNLDFNDAKILRIGKTGERGWKMSDDSIEVEFEVPKQEVGPKSGKLQQTGKTSKIVATFSHQEAQEVLGIKFPSKTQQIIQYSIDYYGRTPEMIVKPTSVSAPNLTMGMFIVKDQGTPGGPINYVPQIKIPRADNPKESDFYFLNDFTAASPAIVQAQVQAFLNSVAKTQKGSLNNQIYPLTNTSELFQFFKAKYSQ